MSAICVFPPPPDRRPKPSRRRTQPESPIYTTSGTNSRSSPASGSSLTSCCSSSGQADNFAAKPDLQPMFIDIFFTSVFNAHLLLHQDSFSHELTAGTCPRHLSLAVFACAINFLEAPYVVAKYGTAQILGVGNSAVEGSRCAVLAAEEVLRDIITPSIDSARTCAILAMYWYCKGDLVRYGMFSCIATGAARLLYQGTLKSGRPWLEVEVVRRVVWSCWWAACLNSDHSIHDSPTNTSVLKTPLPVDADLSGTESVSSLSCTQHVDGLVASRPLPWSTNVNAELTRAILHWVKTQDYVESRSRITAKQVMLDLFVSDNLLDRRLHLTHNQDLDQWLSSFISTLSPGLTYSKRNLYEQVVVKRQTLFPVLHSVLLQCRMVLHTSGLPQSGDICNGVSSQAVNISSTTALQAADAVATIADDMLFLELDPTQFAPVLGHCMYIAANVHIRFVSSKDAALASSARKGMISTLCILKRMKPFYMSLQQLVSRPTHS